MPQPARIYPNIPIGPKTPIALAKTYDRLSDLVYNMWWTWNDDAIELWSRIDPVRWSHSGNPMSILPVVEPSTWEALEGNASYLQLYEDVISRFDEYLHGDNTWYHHHHQGELTSPIAYLCAEFGFHTKIRLYSGGLGILAGDHVKAASDLGIPMLGIGLLYRRGYFQQALDPDGHQQHTFIPMELSRRPIREVLDPGTFRPLRVKVPMAGREISVRAWRIDVGRVPLVLLDTDLPENDPADRPITHLLYVRGREMRFVQEMVLGIGGARVLAALSIEPSMWHVNEGHAALSLLERFSTAVDTGATLEAARQAVTERTLFTLHTPVPAGNEVFDLGLVEHYLGGELPHITDNLLRDLSTPPDGDTSRFDMGALAIRLSEISNGVSRRHGEVSNQTWGEMKGKPLIAITNGIHPQTWVGPNMARLYRKSVGELWDRQVIDHGAWERVRDLPASDVWNAHQTQKQIMLRFLRSRLREQAGRHGRSPERLRWIDDQLPLDRLTLVFARRFATYKRAGLLFTDPARVRALLTNPERPVQIVFAGKAHPADRDGQALIRWVTEMSQAPELEGHIFFIENYDLELGQALVGGADVWLNTPRPPNEASGTSGMKAAANGGLNLSVLDGWWVEGYHENNGWGFSEESMSDAEDAGILYHLLESQVVPAYYDRADAGLPQQWIEMMKESIVGAIPRFSTQRMLVEYAELAYLPLGAGIDED
jgi:starch phosphorylase